MRFNNLFSLSSLLTFAGLAYGSGFRMSFYGVNGNRPSDSAVPACGTDSHYNTDYYIALNKEQYTASQIKSDNPNTASVCDRCVKIKYENKWVVGRIVDSCPGCPYKGLDVSPTIFEVFADRDVGILYMDWEFADCSLLGKSSKSGSSEPSKETTTIKKTTTTTKKTTTTTTIKTTTTTTIRTTTTTTTTVRPTTTKVITTTVGMNLTTKTLPTNANNSKLGGINGTTATKTVIGATGIGKLNATNAANNANQNQGQNQNQNQNQVKANAGETNTGAASKPKVVESTIEGNNDDKGGNTYVLPLTGALAVTGAAGVALVYVKRDSKNVSALKEKFPEAFSNIKRSLTRGSTVVKRSLSQSGKALKRSLSKKGDTSGISSSAGPHIRTKKEYRESLNSHYPVQLYDPPVPSAEGSYSSVPQYNIQHFNAYGDDDDSNLRIDFKDTYH